MTENLVEEEYASLDLGADCLSRRAKQFVSEVVGIGNFNPDRCRTAGGLKALHRWFFRRLPLKYWKNQVDNQVGNQVDKGVANAYVS